MCGATDAAFSVFLFVYILITVWNTKQWSVSNAEVTKYAYKIPMLHLCCGGYHASGNLAAMGISLCIKL